MRKKRISASGVWASGRRNSLFALRGHLNGNLVYFNKRFLVNVHFFLLFVFSPKKKKKRKQKELLVRLAVGAGELIGLFLLFLFNVTLCGRFYVFCVFLVFFAFHFLKNIYK